MKARPRQPAEAHEAVGAARRKFSPDRLPPIHGFTALQYRKRGDSEVAIPSLAAQEKESVPLTNPGGAL